MDEILSVFSEVTKIEKELDDIIKKFENRNSDFDALISRQAILQERFMELDGMYYKDKIKSALIGLGFSEENLSTPLCKLSGGQKTRVALCKILLSNSNLLLLDEPTNHLDIDSCETLENALIDYDGTMFIVSHDRYFINRLADRILYLTPNGIIEYEGNYDDFLESRQEIKVKEKPKKMEDRAKDYKEKKQVEAEKQKKHNRLLKLEELIEKNETKIIELSQKRDNPEIASDYEKLCEITSQIDSLQQEIDEYMNEWENLQQNIEEN